MEKKVELESEDRKRVWKFSSENIARQVDGEKRYVTEKGIEK